MCGKDLKIILDTLKSLHNYIKKGDDIIKNNYTIKGYILIF